MPDPYAGKTDIPGIIYLIHLAEPICHARHYLGWTGTSIEERLATHKACKGSALLRAANQRGIEYEIVAAWEGTRHDERAMKNQKKGPDYCPICRAKPRKSQRVKQIHLLDLINRQ